MNPVHAAREVEKHLQDYIRRTLPMERSLPEMTAHFNDFFTRHRLTQPPYLELMPNYRRGCSLQQLVEGKVILQQTANIVAQGLLGDGGNPANFVLYQHQVDAITAACRQHRNLVVCSGTGSGKTECFLIPLIDHLVRQHEEGRLVSGVYAMILYPMNALVNDQVRRLRSILRFADFIRFGKYTGETPSDHDVDPAQIQLNGLQPVEGPVAGFDDQAPLPNEVSTRAQWQASPAHILVTNYSMLERLLLEPGADWLFQHPWKFIILDEAHSYDGGLGTEIAWLVRRVKRRLGNPQDLRFMATSATLIDEPGLDGEARANLVRERFASRLFPAAPDTFSVHFGEVADFQPFEGALDWNGHQCDPAAYTAIRDHAVPIADLQEALHHFPNLIPLNNDHVGLLQATQDLLGAERWLAALGTAAELAGDAGQPMAAGNVLYLLRQYTASRQALAAPPVPEVLLHHDSLPTLQALLNFLADAVGNLHALDAWREWLHDPTDPRPSSVPGDNYANGQRRRIGNRLHLLDQWTPLHQAPGDLAQLKLEGLEYLFRIAHEAAILVEQEHGVPLPEVLPLPLTLSEHVVNALQTFVEQRNAALHVVATVRRILTGHWHNQLEHHAGHPVPANSSIEQALAWFLGSEPRTMAMLGHLEHARDVQDAAAGQHPSRLDHVADAVFEHQPEAPEQRQEALVALIDLGTLAVPSTPPGNKRPLVDLRYHQFVRGLEEVGVELKPVDNAGQAAVVKLHPGDIMSTADGAGGERAVFTLGVCRDCGQPFAMGYADLQQVDQAPGPVFLGRMSSDTRRYLHAVAWERGVEQPDAEEGFPKNADAGVWLNTRTGELRIAQHIPAGDGWVKGYWHRAGNDNNPSFIGTCPCCGATQTATHRTEFGVITPYSAEGGQFRLVVLDELVQQLDPSPDPLARQHPGEGRKLLTFSDSRRQAAQLALGYQEWFAETTIGRLIPEALGDLVANPRPPELDEALQRRVLAENPDLAAIPAALPAPVLAELVGQLADKPVGVAISLRLRLESLQCGRLLELSKADGSDFDLHEASLIRLLQAIRRKGRHSLLEHGLVQVYSRALQAAQDALAPQWLGALDGIAPDTFLELVHDVHAWLLPRARLSLGAAAAADDRLRLIDGPNWQFKKLVRQDNADGAIRFASEAPGSALNRIVRQALHLPPNAEGRHQAYNFLEALWPLFSQEQGHSRVLVPVNNADYALKHDDLKLSLPVQQGPVGNQEPVPHEQYDRYLATRPILPVRIEEHTAQISSDRGAAYQRGFGDGRVNVLSCSTTFEMGVDLGELNCVFLANVPPGVTNYRQRAGRAGRRPGAAAYVLSFMGGSPHDRYYFAHPEQLLFGRMSLPRIYLENPVFRARHLRAEALHHFLSLFVPEADRVNPQQNNDPQVVNRNWHLSGHFFVGLMVARINVPGVGWRRRITGVFDPIVSELPGWVENEHQAVQEYILAIDDVPADLGYNVANDLVWQIKVQQGQPEMVSPYPLEAANLQRYRELASANLPKAHNGALLLDDNPRRREAEKRYIAHFDTIGAGHHISVQGLREHAANQNIPAALVHLLQSTKNDDTISWLTRCGIIPKYGFPVDVIRLVPNQDDPFGTDVELERDLRLGIYEYAPGQQVCADKRWYESREPAVYAQGGLNDALGQAIIRWLCRDCGEVFTAAPEPYTCTACQSGNLSSWPVIRPDAFLANASRGGAGGIVPPRASPVHVYSGGYRADTIQQVNGTAIATAESESGEISFFNFGPRDAGFMAGANQPYALYHDVKTDIALWLPRQVQLPPQFNGPRARNAWRSALEAIVRAAGIVLDVSDRDIGGLLFPFGQGGTGLVLYDEAAAGGGAVLPLVLSGDPARDVERVQLIQGILQRALDLCDACHCGGAEVPAIVLEPVNRETFLAELHQQGNRRVRAACYGCLKSYRNQRVHHLLDRFDAMIVLDALLNAPGGNGGGAAGMPAAPGPIPVPNAAGPDPVPNAPGVEFDGPRWPGLPANRQPRYRKLNEGEPIERLKLYVIGRDEGPGVYLANQVSPDRWVFTPAGQGLPVEAITITPDQRARILARVIG